MWEGQGETHHPYNFQQKINMDTSTHFNFDLMKNCQTKEFASMQSVEIKLKISLTLIDIYFNNYSILLRIGVRAQFKLSNDKGREQNNKLLQDY